MDFAYADPPYYGCGKLYAAHHPDALDWDQPGTHRKLIDRLSLVYPDGWAMSCSSPSLKVILPMCPDDVRVCSWVKPFAIFKPNVGLAYAWEPIILRGGRKITREQDTVRDWVSANITLKRGLTGAKPKDFSMWLFRALNIQKGDTLTDIFPGTGAVTAAFREFVGDRTEPELLELI